MGLKLPKDLEAKVLAQSVPANRAGAVSGIWAEGLMKSFVKAHIAELPTGAMVWPAVTLLVPVKLVSEMNRRDHWAVRKRRFDTQAAAVRQALVASGMAEPLLTWIGRNAEPVRVRITRIGRQKLDGDNLQGAAKAVRDEIARFLLLDDGSDRWRWEYDQRQAKSYAVAIHISTGSQEIAA